jgi:hypothetical protein
MVHADNGYGKRADEETTMSVTGFEGTQIGPDGKRQPINEDEIQKEEEHLSSVDKRMVGQMPGVDEMKDPAQQAQDARAAKDDENAANKTETLEARTPESQDEKAKSQAGEKEKRQQEQAEQAKQQ